MDIKIEEKDMQLSEEQVETFAFNVFRDIGDYILQNQTAFLKWCLGNLSNIVSTSNGIELIDTETYKYELCNYGGNIKWMLLFMHVLVLQSRMIHQ